MLFTRTLRRKLLLGVGLGLLHPAFLGLAAYVLAAWFGWWWLTPVLVFLIWWTMFSGRRGGEWHDDAPDSTPGETPPQAASDAQAKEGESLQPPERGGTRKDIG